MRPLVWIRFLARELASAEQDEENGYPMTMTMTMTMVSDVGCIRSDIARQVAQIDLGGRRNTLLSSFRQPVKSANHLSGTNERELIFDAFLPLFIHEQTIFIFIWP